MPKSDWTPNTADVAAKVPTRLSDAGGNLKDDFDEETTPTQLQVSRLIEASVRELSRSIPDNLPDDEDIDSAKELVALRTAMWVEVTYFPRQVGVGESPYREFKDLFGTGLDALKESVTEHGGGVDEDTGVPEGPTLRPAGAFPDPEESIGLHTQW